MGYTNSPLVSHVNISPNRTVPRNHAIDRITIHCVVGQCSVETLGQIFAPVSRQASSNYGIGYDGRVGMYCPESDRSWCSSSPQNDHRAVTIETASDTYHPYAVNSVAYNRLIDLCVDICKRNGKNKLLWLGWDGVNYNPKSNEMVMTAHRFFANTICPGDYLYSRFGDIADKVNARIGKNGLYYENGQWWYYQDGSKATWFTGLVQNDQGWWYVQNGTITFKYNGLAQNEQGWWRIVNSKVDFSFTGLQFWNNVWWYLRNGKIDWNTKTVAHNKYGWWYVENGKVDRTYYGLAQNENGWWFCQKGKVTFKYTGLAQNEMGWWYCKDSKVDFKYHGLAKNGAGTWYCVNGKVDFGYNGTWQEGKYIYTIKGGKVIKKSKIK